MAISNGDGGAGNGGLYVYGVSPAVRVGTNADGVSDALERNVIAGNIGYDAVLAADGTVFAGNYLGVNSTATSSIEANVGSSTLVVYGNSNRIGTNADGAVTCRTQCYYGHWLQLRRSQQHCCWQLCRHGRYRNDATGDRSWRQYR